MRRSRLAMWMAVLLATTVSMLVLDVDPAQACSCMRSPETAPLEDLDAAFIGIAREVVAEIPSSDADYPSQIAIMRFEVTEVIKGDIGESAFVMVLNHPPNSSTCGDAVFVPGGPLFDKEAGIMIHDAATPRAREVCTNPSADYVRSGVEGLEPSNPNLRAQALVIGEFRGTSMRLVGSDGQIVAYLQDEHPVGHSIVCADGETLASIVSDGVVLSIQWRNLRTLNLVAIKPINFVSDTAIEDAIVVDCLSDMSAVVGRSRELRLLDPRGRVLAFPPGQASTGSISPDGTLFARWIDATSFELTDVGVSPEQATVISIDNHQGHELAISPDNTRFAFFRGDSPGLSAGRRVVIVDIDGTALYQILQPELLKGLSWLDDETLAVGTTRIDLGGAEPRTVAHLQGETFTPWYRSMKGPRVLIDDGSGPMVLGIRNGWTLDVGGYNMFGEVLALPAPIDVTGIGFVPPERPATPLPGARLPRTSAEIEQTLATAQDFLPITPDPDDGFDLADVNTPASTDVQPRQQPAWLVLVYGGLIFGGLVALFNLATRWLRTRRS